MNRTGNRTVLAGSQKKTPGRGVIVRKALLYFIPVFLLAVCVTVCILLSKKLFAANYNYYLIAGGVLVCLALIMWFGSLKLARTRIIQNLSEAQLRANLEQLIQKRTEELAESETRFRQLFENMSSGVAVYQAFNEGEDFTIMHFNRASEKMDDISRNNVVGNKLREVFPGVEEFGLLEVLRRVWRTGQPEFFPAKTYRDDRISGWRENYVYKLPTGEVVAIYDDITAMKQAEQELAEENRIRTTLIEALPYPTMLIRKDRTVLFANKIAREVGATIGGQCWEDFGQCLFIPDEHKARVNQHALVPPGWTHCTFCRADEALQDSKTEIAPEVQAFGKIWETYWVPVSDDVYLHFALDVTDRMQAEEDKISLERQVLHAQKLESLGVLAGGIAHDFNNLLMVILGNADLALRRMSPLSPSRNNITEIEKASRRAADLTRQMLAFSGKGKFVIEPIDLGLLVSEMTHLLDISMSKKAVLKCNLADNLPAFDGDATQIRQIIMNLITNASEAIAETSGMITLTTGEMECDLAYLETIDNNLKASIEDPLPEGKYVFVEISDTGCGMDAQTLDKIFDPFFTTKFTGRGLGMAAVLGIVRGHKGAITVYSEVEKGSTFRVLFPTHAQTEHDEADEVISEDIAESWRGKGTVLLADDEETVRALGERMLCELGFNVLTAIDGPDAVDMFRNHAEEIDLVLLDLTMPGLDGKEVFRELKLLQPNLSVILSSGYAEENATQGFFGKGLAGFIQKPFTLKLLKDILMKTLGEDQ